MIMSIEKSDYIPLELLISISLGDCGNVRIVQTACSAKRVTAALDMPGNFNTCCNDPAIQETPREAASIPSPEAISAGRGMTEIF